MPTNATALSRLVLTERLSLLRLARRIVGTGPAAEDVAQSLWLRVQRVEDDPPILNKRAYLYRLATNLALDHASGEARRASVHEEAQALLWGADHALAADRAVIAREMLQRIEVAIGGLPEQTRRIFELHRYEGLTQRALADRLGISTTAVEKHMRRAMRVLAEARDGGS
jgi:RNA polymerase sigma factor (sigma-70 family)